jgi:muramoyltetrapeptide carboxypeptidase
MTAGPGLAWPPALQAGDTVAVVSPSGPAPADELTRGCERLRSWGLEVRVGAHSADADGYLAGRDQDRADDFEAAWSDDDVKAVIAARGGYGAMRMVDLVDWGALRSARPKLLVGYSDITVLHLAVAHHLGLGSVYGPMVTGLLADQAADPVSVERYADVLFGRDEHPRLPGTWGRGGLVRGPLHGGCLTLLASVVGSALATPPSGAIVFLEDVDEEPYRLDRLLTQLLRAGWFAGVAGLALGTWTGCGDEGVVQRVLHDRLDPLGVPIVAGLPAGHGPLQASLPLGRVVELDGRAATLHLAVGSSPGVSPDAAVPRS